MKKVLLLKTDFQPDDQGMTPTDYSLLHSNWNQMGRRNAGNLAFNSAIEQYLIQSNTYFESNVHNLDYDKYRNYSFAIQCPGNFFSKRSIKKIDHFTEKYKKLGIPIYVLSVGIQEENSCNLKELVQTIREPVKRYVDTIYESGGELTLRGYITKEVLDSIVPDNTAYVLGCISMYQNGRNFRVDTPNIAKEDFTFSLNGKIDILSEKIIKRSCKKYNHTFVDQDMFGDILYGNYNDIDINFINTLKYVRRFSYKGLIELSRNNLKLFYDLPIWKQYLSKYNLSFGSRIHGNIISLLSGTPAMVYKSDLRVQEIADYFSIPSIGNDINKYEDLYELYKNLDYSHFNEKYQNHYDEFINFMNKIGLNPLVDSNEYNMMLCKNGNWSMPPKGDYCNLSANLNKYKCIMKIGDYFFKHY